MKVIKPVEFTNAMLTASNAPETEYAAWVSTTAYAVLDRVIYDHAIYEAAQASTGKQPDVNPLDWTYISVTNRFMMFDAEVNTQTVVNSPLQVTVAPGLVNSMALLELQGAQISITGRDGAAGPIIYQHDQPLEGSVVSDWYEYFFEPFSLLTELVLTNLPAYNSLHVSVDINSGPVVSPVACGALIFGSVYDIGRSLRGATAGILSFSKKETSANGTTRFKKGRSSRRGPTRVVIDNVMLNKVYRLLSSLDATPCVWIGSDDPNYSFLTRFGFYRDFSIDVEYADMSYCSIDIEGLV